MPFEGFALNGATRAVVIVDFESSIFERARACAASTQISTELKQCCSRALPVQVLRGNSAQTHPRLHQLGAGSVPASKGIDSSDAPLAGLRPAISDFPSRGPSTCSLPSYAGTVLPPCDGIGRRASQFPWQGCLSRLLTSWLFFLNPTVLEAPHARLKSDVGVTPLPGGACTLRTPATASPSALPAGWNNTGIASGRTRTATPCIPWRTQTSPCTSANGRAPYCRSVLSLSRISPSRAATAPFRT